MSCCSQAIDLTGFHRGGDLGNSVIEIVEKKLRQFARQLAITTDHFHQGGFVECIGISVVSGHHTGQ